MRISAAGKGLPSPTITAYATIGSASTAFSHGAGTTFFPEAVTMMSFTRPERVR